MSNKISIFWFRRDLRLNDNAGLFYALKKGNPVLPIFIFDPDILDELKDKKDKRVDFIHRQLVHIQKQLILSGSSFRIFHCTPLNCFKELITQYDIDAVYTNHDYEPYPRSRDKAIAEFLERHNIQFYSFKDQVIFEKNEVVKDNGKPYTVYTPYSNKWKARLTDYYLASYPSEGHFRNFLHCSSKNIPSLISMGFEKTDIDIGAPEINEEVAVKYDETRDFPAMNGTTKLGVHLRFGTISIRQLVKHVIKLNETLLNELIWREFFQMILWHFPHTVNTAFKPEYDNIKWRNNEHEFEKWCNGNTGYPIVDAGMRELNETGYMHNRVRMIVSSFLTKDLLIDWRWGEAYFAEKLLDYEMASNVGNWQWVAGCGCDAAPYFRIFNPLLQTKKFDPDLEYVRKWVPEFESPAYPAPIVDHAKAKERCLTAYKKALRVRSQ